MNKERVKEGLVRKTIELGRLPCVTFAAGGIATPADAALMMYHGVDGVFVGSGIFESSDSKKMAEAVTLATTYYNNYDKLIEACDMASNPMKGVDSKTVEVKYEDR